MQPIKPKWMKSGLVLVCERCYKERIPEEDPDKAEEIGDFNLRNWLKKRLKEEGHWGKVRAIGTTCMDVCARRLVTVTIDPQTDDKQAEAFVVDPVADKEELYQTIVKKLGEKSD
jgi:predicted metal-binding protein